MTTSTFATLATTLRLERGQSTRLPPARPAQLVSVAGTLWVTIDHDRRDIVLEAGEAIDLQGDAPVVVSPLAGPAMLRLTPEAQPASPPAGRAVASMVGAGGPVRAAARPTAQPLPSPAGGRLAGATP